MSSMTTILCSNYNSKEWINSYLDYLNKQIIKEFDVIFVDANSTDGSLDVIKNYNFRPGINKKIIEHNVRIPIYEAWNEAILNATTPYVMNYNTDDCLYPTALMVCQSYAMMNPSVDVFYSPCLVSSDKDHKAISNIYLWREYSHESLLQGCFMGPYPYLKRSSVIEDGLFNPKYTISGDYEMWLRMSKKGRSFYKIPEVLGCYFNNPVGMSTSKDQERVKNHWMQDAEIRFIHK